MNEKVWLGVDPGKSGALSAIHENGEIEYILCKQTERDLWDWLKGQTDGKDAFALLEKVGARPGQGVSSMFKFGTSYGFLRGILIACTIPFEEVTPATWQRALRCLTKGDKNVTKSKAQELFPAIKVTHGNADALLIAEHCKRLQGERRAESDQVPTTAMESHD